MCCCSSVFAILPWCAVLVSAFCFFLQFIVLPSDEWGHFVTREVTDVLRQKGHFGLWRLCSVSIQYDKERNQMEEEENCSSHPEDENYQLPTNASAAGAISIIHLLLMASFVVIASVRVIQLAKNAPDLYLGTRRVCVVKISLAVICILFSISTSILASVGEGNVRQFNVFKGWAFWLQIVIISLDIVLLLICAFEQIQFWQMSMAEPPPKDATDEFPETFIVPDYDLVPPTGHYREESFTSMKDAGVQSQLDNDRRHHPVYELFASR